jgi:hypothetical protein
MYLIRVLFTLPARRRNRRTVYQLTTPMVVGGFELGPLVHVHPATVDQGDDQ